MTLSDEGPGSDFETLFRVTFRLILQHHHVTLLGLGFFLLLWRDSDRGEPAHDSVAGRVFAFLGTVQEKFEELFPVGK